MTMRKQRHYGAIFYKQTNKKSLGALLKQIPLYSRRDAHGSIFGNKPIFDNKL